MTRVAVAAGLLRWARERAREGGGAFYRTQTTRAGRRFGRAVLESTLEGRTLYRDALAMLGIRRQATFEEFIRRERARLVLASRGKGA